MAHFTRREFLQTGLAAGTLAMSGSLPLIVQGAQQAKRGSATDMVTLGHSGVRVTRLAFGTGTFSGQVQRDLGQDGFTRLVRHAYDSGIRFFETSESYAEMHRMLGVALKGLPRDSYQLMSKVTTRDGVNPQQKFDELRRLANTEYFDIMLLHWQHTATWPTDTTRWQDAILETQSRKVVLSHGASVHGLPALRRVPGNKWLQIAMIRMNHKGKVMDAEDYATQGPGNVAEVVTHVQEVRAQGLGVISMKLAGEGTFDREDRRKAMRFAFRDAGVDCVTVGYKSPAEVDEAIENLNLALA
jgi:aryl-alcohol dehydrogenase-like predicted oxidoreductase